MQETSIIEQSEPIAAIVGQTPRAPREGSELSAFVLRMLAKKPEQRIATGQQVAAWWSSQHSGNAPGHPVDVFAPLHQPPELK